MCFQNLLKKSAFSQLAYLLGSPFHRTRYSITRGTPYFLVTHSARILFTSFSREATNECRPVHFRCLESCFLLPIEFTFPLVTSPCVCGLPQLAPLLPLDLFPATVPFDSCVKQVLSTKFIKPKSPYTRVA